MLYIFFERILNKTLNKYQFLHGSKAGKILFSSFVLIFFGAYPPFFLCLVYLFIYVVMTSEVTKDVEKNDPSNPFFIHHSDHRAMILVSDVRFYKILKWCNPFEKFQFLKL